MLTPSAAYKLEGTLKRKWKAYYSTSSKRKATIENLINEKCTWNVHLESYQHINKKEKKPACRNEMKEGSKKKKNQVLLLIFTYIFFVNIVINIFN